MIVAAYTQNFQFKGFLKDSLFLQSDSVVVEVLETGESTIAHFGIEFQLELPYDTVWNICFSDSLKENCYEITYIGTDSIITQVIGVGVTNQILFDNTEEDVLLAVEADTSNLEIDSAQAEELENEINQTINKRTKLRTTVVRLRKRPKRALGKTTISAKSIKRMPSLAEADVIKSIQALPGVVASSDFSSKLYVRGAGADQNLFLFDNVVIYSPIHLFGLFSTFLVEGIDEVNFYKGGFSPEYGNRLSSVVDVKSRRGGNDSTNTYYDGSSVKISTFASQLHWEGRHEDFRWLIAGRATYIKAMMEFFKWAGFIDFVLDYHFWDRQGSFAYDFSRDQTLMFSFYVGEDRLVFDPLRVKWGNDAYALNYKHRKIFKNTDLYATVGFNKFYQDAEVIDLFKIENGISSNGYKSYKARLEFYGLDDHRFMTGVEIQEIKTLFNMEFLFLQNDSALNADTDSTDIDSTEADSTEAIDFDGEPDKYSFWVHSAFLSDEMTLGDFTVTPGVRINYHSGLKEFYYEPRVSVRYSFAQNQAIDFHFGRYKQFVNSLQSVDLVSINEQYYPTRETHFRKLEPSQCDLLSLGYHHPRLFDMFAFTFETYYKVFQNLYVYDPLSTPQEVSQSEDAILGDNFIMGEGYSYGLEVLVRKDEGNIFGGISYTYGRSVLQDLTESATSVQKDSAAYFANWDQTHSVKLDMGVNWMGQYGIWKFKDKTRYWRSSLAWKVASGLPYPSIAGHMPTYQLDAGAAGEGAGTYQQNISSPQAGRNRARYPWYNRLDIKVFDIGRLHKWGLSYSIINVFDIENVFFYSYDKSSNPPEKDTITQLPRILVMINFEYFF